MKKTFKKPIKSPAVISDDINFESDLAIDPDALDVEWIRQPMLFGRYSALSAKAKRRNDRARHNRDAVLAEMSAKVRLSPESYGMSDGKLAQSGVELAAQLTDEWKEANDEVTQSQYKCDMLEAAVRSLHHKRDALENLVRLHGSEYFAGPKAPRNLTDEMQIHEKKSAMAKSKMREAMGVSR